MRQYNFTISDNDYEVVIKDVTEEDLTAEVNGEVYVVKIKDIKDLSKVTATTPATSVAKSPPFVASPAAASASSPARKAPGNTGLSGGVDAPMPGQIIDVFVSEGDKVLSGQKVLVLEAMKLENTLTANRDGVVTKILVKDGDIVSQNQTLLVIN
jgi:biotin carboxyl carrier protein